jgi:putative restriction endonuclease
VNAEDARVILAKFDRLNVWQRGDERAPHKPLLLLLALGFFSRGLRTFAYVDIEKKLAELLREFAPSRRSVHPEYPFWRLRSDGVWLVDSTVPMRTRASNTDIPRTELRAANAIGHFTPEVQKAFDLEPQLVAEVAQRLLEAHFPESLRQDILDAVDLTFASSSATRRRRDPGFRNAVLSAYQYRCALCGLDIRLGSVTIGLEAAHIRWHQANGPNEVSNGVALCSIHHKLFDLGAFTFEFERRILVSEQVHGTEQFDQVLLRHHGRQLLAPIRPEHRPLATHLGWHRSQVFKAEARPLATLQGGST